MDIFEEAFVDNRNNWPIGETKDQAFKIQGMEGIFTNFRNSNPGWILIPLSIPPYQAYSIYLWINYVKSLNPDSDKFIYEPSYYGLVWGYNNNHFYTLCYDFTGENVGALNYGCYQITDGEWKVICDWNSLFEPIHDNRRHYIGISIEPYFYEKSKKYHVGWAQITDNLSQIPINLGNLINMPIRYIGLLSGPSISVSMMKIQLLDDTAKYIEKKRKWMRDTGSQIEEDAKLEGKGSVNFTNELFEDDFGFRSLKEQYAKLLSEGLIDLTNKSTCDNGNSNFNHWFNSFKPDKQANLGNVIEVNIVGVTYEGRQEVVTQLSVGEKVLLRREPNNPYDSNAIAVDRMNGQQIGYISRQMADWLAKQLDNCDEPVTGFVTELTGNYSAYSNRGVKIRFTAPGQNQNYPRYEEY